jgi:hypothetical protein
MQAAECMGVPGPTTENLEDLKKRFSDDILKIELLDLSKGILAWLMSRGFFTVSRSVLLSGSQY